MPSRARSLVLLVLVACSGGEPRGSQPADAAPPSPVPVEAEAARLDGGATAADIQWLAFAPDGKTLRVSYGDRIVIHDAVTARATRELTFPPGTVVRHHAGETLLVGGVGGFFTCKVASGACEAIPGAKDSELAALSPSGRLAVFGALDYAQVMGFSLRVYDVTARTWRRPVKGTFPALAAGGVLQFCDGFTETQARWCHTRVRDELAQDLGTGRVALAGPRASKTWQAKTNRTPGRPSGIELTGPGKARWVEASDTVVAPWAVTCGTSNRALVWRATTLELRALPGWQPIRSWPVAVTQATCSPDGKRVAFVSDGLHVEAVDR